jgi:hypothetical protein
VNTYLYNDLSLEEEVDPSLVEETPFPPYDATVNGNRNGHAPAESPAVALAAVVVGDPTVTVGEFIARKPDGDLVPLVGSDQGPVIAPASLTLVAGKASAGKTTWAVDLILHAAAGEPYCGLAFPRPLRTLVIENEGPREGFRQKLEARLPHGPSGESLRVWDDPRRWGMVRVSDDVTLEQLVAVIEQHQIDLVVSDSLTRFGMRGNGTPEETRDFVHLLVQAGLGRNVAFLILVHTRTRTEDGEDELEQLAGAWAPHADTIVMLKKLSGNRARLSYPKTRWARGTVPASILSFDPDSETFTLVATEDEASHVTAETYEQRILEWLVDNPWATTDELDEGVEGRASEVREARKRLREAGRVTATPSAQLGRPGKGQRWNLAPTGGFSPVRLPGTPWDRDSRDPEKDGQPRPPRPALRRDGGGDGVAGRGTEEMPDDDWTAFEQ